MVAGAFIELEEPDRVYDCGDTVVGVARLVLSSDIRVSGIELKLCCRESVTVAYEGTSADGYTYRGKDTRREKSVTIPRRISHNGKHESFVMAEGRYSYPFKFKIPNSEEIRYPTFKSDSGSIKWYIKIVVRRPGKLRSNIRGEQMLTIRWPLNALAVLSQAVKYSLSTFIEKACPQKNGSKKINHPEFMVDATSLREVPSTNMWKKFLISRGSSSRLSEEGRVRISVDQIIQVTGCKHSDTTRERLDLLDCNFSGEFDSSSWLNAIIGNLELPDELVPGFESQCFIVKHEVVIEGSFMPGHNGTSRKALAVRTKVG